MPTIKSIHAIKGEMQHIIYKRPSGLPTFKQWLKCPIRSFVAYITEPSNQDIEMAISQGRLAATMRHPLRYCQYDKGPLRDAWIDSYNYFSLLREEIQSHVHEISAEPAD